MVIAKENDDKIIIGTVEGDDDEEKYYIDITDEGINDYIRHLFQTDSLFYKVAKLLAGNKKVTPDFLKENNYKILTICYQIKLQKEEAERQRIINKINKIYY